MPRPAENGQRFASSSAPWGAAGRNLLQAQWIMALALGLALTKGEGYSETAQRANQYGGDRRTDLLGDALSLMIGTCGPDGKPRLGHNAPSTDR